jgi:hypothetical chaperone protein
MVGIDFGTTNSSIAMADAQGRVRLVQFPATGGLVAAYRSLLYLEQTKSRGRSQLHSWSGPEGIERYLAAEPKGRLIQSLKSYLSSRTLTGTEVFGRRQLLEDLVARILADLRQHAEAYFGCPIHAATVGRPVHFVGAGSTADDEFALARLRDAFSRAGFTHVDFEFEPVAAAYHYASTLSHEELVLIGDFGGGTSDFSLLRLRPNAAQQELQTELLATSGVGLAGDAFDARLVRHLVSPHLGADTLEKSGDKTLVAVPSWVYRRLEHWHHLSFLRTRAVSEMLRAARVRAFEPEKIAALSELIEADLGYQLHQAVQSTKIALSRQEDADFRFDHHDIHLQASVARTQFESWIAADLASIAQAVEEVMVASGLRDGAVNRVFLTGGTSLVPAVRRIFERRYGADCVRTGDEFTSVASGLALRARASHETLLPSVR